MNILKVLGEQIANIALAHRVGKFEVKSKNGHNYLGSFWEVFTPLLQIAIYWFVFTSIMKRTDITLNNGEIVPYIYWMLIGYVVWMFNYKAIIDSSSSVYSRLGMLKRIEYPTASVPLIPVMNQLTTHVKLFTVAYIILLFAGYTPTMKMLQLLWGVPMMIFFFMGFGLLTSTISTMMRDFHQLLNAVMKMFLYVSPVLWQVSKIGGEIGNALRFNPIYYFIETYRAAIFGNEWYAVEHMDETISVVIVSIVIYAIGAKLHVTYREKFNDQ